MTRKLTLLVIFVWFFTSCNNQSKQTGPTNDQEISGQYRKMITSDELSASLHFLASDFFEGRATGTRGQQMAAHYLASSLIQMGVPPLKSDSTMPLTEQYFREFRFSRNGDGIAQNVFAFFEGSDPVLKNEIILFSAHYDHLGIDTKLKGDSIFNGAADDGSGSVVLLEVAESFAAAFKNGEGSKRSIMFAWFAGEEIGIQGSSYYALEANPEEIRKIAVQINLDGAGGFDLNHPTKSQNYIYLVLNDSTSQQWEANIKSWGALPDISIDVDRPLTPERFDSDNRPFAYFLVPTIYFSSGLTEHYHKVSDHPSTIDYRHLEKVARLTFATGWELGNSSSLPLKLNRNDYELSGQYVCHPCGCAKDNQVFSGPGKCDACGMPLYPTWKKKS